MITAKEAAKIVGEATYGKVDPELQMLEIEANIQEAISKNKRGISCYYLNGGNHNKLQELGYSVLGSYRDADGKEYHSINW